MTIALIAIVLAVGVGAVVAVSARDPGAAAIGLTVALVAATLLADPLPGAAVLAVRVIGALLAATLVRSAITSSPHQPSRLGWAAEALLGTAGAIAGLGLAAGLAAAAGAVGGNGAGPDGGGAGPAPDLLSAATSTGLILAGSGLLIACAATAAGLSRAIPEVAGEMEAAGPDRPRRGRR